MTGAGRPLRFLALVSGGWITLRVVLLWPSEGSLPAAIRAALPIPAIARADPVPAEVRTGWHAPTALVAAGRIARPVASPDRAAVFSLEPRPARTIDPARVQLALLGFVGVGQRVQILPAVPMLDAAVVAPPIGPAMPGISGSAWALTRGGATPATGQRLGDGQVGARLRMPVADDGRLAVAGRAAAPLRGRGADAGIGIEWRPAGAPVALVAEQRIGLDGTPGGPSLGAIAGVDAMPIALGFAVEAYGQAGAIARDHVDGYADGAVRAMRPVATVGATRVRLGVGAWGGAQREAARLDIGPSAVATLPIGDRAMRVSLDWRERVAGDASPGSGPAISIGADF